MQEDGLLSTELNKEKISEFVKILNKWYKHL
jgi:hypothetical protein